ncbi:hypothetical protein [[Collinsella] massiliensis]|uniref:Uncharacterized protein n=1 Tax=[Collinsella] massiliensis TaxID=1232426 RepID=A0A1Y3Y0E5_9ACTN|nr:hypothetical protein [[Collinsella] massiliensis]OUN88849.1 hypothetical protein B5G02_04600 [[Collinsella] massiliensis]
MQKLVHGAGTWSAVCAIVAGALALFGTVGIFGVELPLATMPHTAGEVASTLLQITDSLDAFPGASGRVAQIVAFLQSVAHGSLASIFFVLSATHVAVCAGAVILAGYDLARGHRAWRCVLAGALAAADALIVTILCSTVSWQLFLIVRSVAQGNPWAVGRGVAGLDTTLSPGLGLIAAAILGLAAIVLALVARGAGRKRQGEAA